MLALAPPLTHTHSTPGPSTARAARPLPRKQASSSVVTTTTSFTSSSSSGTLSVSTHPAPLSRTSSSTHPPHSRHASGNSLPGTAHPTSAGPAAGPSQSKTRTDGALAGASSSAAAAPAVPPPVVANGGEAHTAEDKLDIHSYNPQDLLRLLASLLTQIATTNDALPSAGGSAVPSFPPSPADDDGRPPIWRTLTSASRASLGTPSTVLSFHARNVPTISLEAYLLRILKYCPTTNEVFLSLLVYFDRMSKLVGDATGRTFVIDSYNVHRLVIAGVTVASKFFSDVFYTNSRYAKVGGLPQAELNQLELQFLLLNDFRLTIHPDEMQRYAEQLVAFAAHQAGDSTDEPVPMPCPIIKAPVAPVTSSPKRQKVAEDAPQHAASVYSDYAGGPRAMGAIDAYGGRLPSDDAYSRARSSPPKTPGARGVRTPLAGARRSTSPIDADGPSHAAGRYERPPHSRTSSFASAAPTDSESECGQSEADTEGGETDDEPTIRAAPSVCGSEASGWAEDGPMGSP